MLVVATSAGAQPWLAAIAGAFKPPDFAQDIAAAQVWAEGLDPYDAEFTVRHARLLGTQPAKGYPYFPHPPFAIVLSLPFAFVAFSSAALLWYAVSLALLGCLALLLAEIVSGTDVGGRRNGPSLGLTIGIFLTLLLWPPVLYNLEKGQFSILLAVLFALAWRACRHQRARHAGALIGVATAIKVFPLLAGLYLVRRDVRAVTWAAATAAIFSGLPLIWLGLPAINAFVNNSQANVAYWQTWPAVTYSIHGAIARLLIGGTWAEPAWQVPALAHASIVAISVALVVITATVTGKRSGVTGDDGLTYGAWVALLVLLNPLSMGHNGVLLSLPIALLGRALHRNGGPLAWTAWATGVILVSIPRQTIFELAPIPVSPADGILIVALPMWGALILFAGCAALGPRGSTAPRTATAVG